MTTLLKSVSDLLRIAVTFSDLRTSSTAANRKTKKKFYAGRVKVDFKIPVTNSHSEH